MNLGRERIDPGIYFGCGEATYFVDGFVVDKSYFYAISLHEIAWVEVYPRSATMPREFMTSGTRGCGAVVIFRKQKVGR